jgi:hypothetical protein
VRPPTVGDDIHVWDLTTATGRHAVVTDVTNVDLGLVAARDDASTVIPAVRYEGPGDAASLAADDPRGRWLWHLPAQCAVHGGTVSVCGLIRNG